MRVDQLLQFILAVAGQQDELRDRELGPIHLLKYAYLADVAHAQASNGETFTGAPWQFYDFGPWSPAVLDRIEPAVVEAAGAERRTVSGVRYGDFVRYALHDERLLDRLDHQLPGSVVSAVRWAVRQFGTDTPALLRHVYLTHPMLRAAPGEHLVFEAGPVQVGLAAESAVDDSARAKQRTKIAQRLRESVRRRLAERRGPAPMVPTPAPRYDEVFFDGVDWLARQAGDSFPLSNGELSFSPTIWKSRGRAESDEDAPS